MENEATTNTFSVLDIADTAVKSRSNRLSELKDFIKNELKDGIDYGVIAVKKDTYTKPCLFKPGAEKICIFLELTPRYTLMSHTFLPNQPKQGKAYNEVTKKYEIVESIRNYYAWEWKCSLCYGDIETAQGVGMANTEESKYANQYNKGTATPDSMANTVLKISKKRALVDAVLGVGGLSDLFTQDLDDDPDIMDMRADKTTPKNKLTKDQKKTLYANTSALELEKMDLDNILAGFGYSSINDVKPTDYNNINIKLKELAKSRKGA